ncbi:MAG TPA: hypothetical protein VMB73_01655, partial [Acetobacteraceae bacterium]|nr:hypothetical protein [Acetobacteraceae bacterium]
QCAGMDDAFEHAVRLVEAFIFASAEPVAARALWRLIPMPYSASEVLEALRGRSATCRVSACWRSSRSGLGPLPGPLLARLGTGHGAEGDRRAAWASISDRLWCRVPHCAGTHSELPQ